MEQTLSIPKNRSLSLSEDYQLLRKAGLEYIESLGSDLWTDYNAHDPGITILETLCYAITELGYRTNIDIKDILTGTDGKIPASQPFYTAKNILTCSALTINDYRKLLIDIAGVHNAWLFADDSEKKGNEEVAINEAPLFADCKKDQLTTDKTPHPLFLSGLYTVLLDLDNDDQFGDLNKGDIEIFNPVSSGAQPKFKAGDISFTIELPNVGDVDMAFVKTAIEEIHITKTEITQKDGKWFCTVTIDAGSKSMTFQVTVNLQRSGKKITLADMQDFFSIKYASQVFYQYGKKIEKINSVFLDVKRTIHASRNLCEDFLSIDNVRDEDVAICCDIDVLPDTDMEEVQAEAFYLIENYLNPAVNFYLLKELRDKGRTVDQVFEGPQLNHGFIDTEELEGTQLREVIYTSDIINLLMDIKGVLAVKNFLLTKYDDNGKAVEIGLKWCMHIKPKHKPVLSVNRSKIVFYKNNFPFLAAYSELRDALKILRGSRERPKLKGQQHDLPIPVGTFQPLDEYYSIQNDLPQTYGVGEAGLPLTATPSRKAQAKQLKAYLLFYDQLLSGFFSQLSNAKGLFGLDNIKQTYYSGFLEDISNILPVYKQVNIKPEFTSDNILLKEVFKTPDSSMSSANKRWKLLVEDETLFEDRRNRFLDHLLARFAESFNEYVLMMYSINYEEKTVKALSAAELVNSKIDFLKDYPDISYARGVAFNYYPLTSTRQIDKNKLWDTDNVSGLEKRASKLAGIKNYARRFLSCIKKIDIQEETVLKDGSKITTYTFSIQNKNGDSLVQKEKFTSGTALQKVITELIPLLSDKSNYLYDAPSDKIEIIGSSSNVLAVSSGTYAKKSAAEAAMLQFVKEFKEDCPDAEGMLLVEHLLLRPRSKDYKLLQVCLNKDCEFCGEEDPYTFRVSVFLPYWAEHFNHINFRTYFENMIRAEVPAHIMLKICWINNTQMRQLEAAYKQWVNALANQTHDPANTDFNKSLQAANDTLVSLLAEMHTIYPEATLHDCDESVNTNPVQLGKTILGSLKPKSNE